MVGEEDDEGVGCGGAHAEDGDDEDMHRLANWCGASVCVDDTDYVTGVLTIKV